MNYRFDLMTQKQAEIIAYHWHYEGEYSFYDMEADPEDLAVFLNAKTRGESMYAVSMGNEIIGFFSVQNATKDTYEIGLGMRPDLTGSGKGLAFLKAGIDFVQATFTPKKIILSVATFNQRAIKVYRKLGFKDTETFMQHTNGSTFEFLKMTYEGE
ncbi:GNAT family N-acetyltransferase [Bacillus sp. 2205SS5-2]|uniref:GNAT family N-acetyltransferase n=1 Tax=Bacillus sp. 2205SS5-2 TaxID=3109031 RepID=UPI00300513C5